MYRLIQENFSGVKKMTLKVISSYRLSEDIIDYSSDIPSELLHKFTPVTLTEMARTQGVINFDITLPQDWVTEFEKLTGFNPVSNFVWDYDDNNFGRPRPVTLEGMTAYSIYNHILGRV